MMNKFRTSLTTSGVFLTIFLLPSAFQDVHAYIDPGTGSLIIQVLIAGFFAGLFALKVYWRKVNAFFKNVFSGTRKKRG